MLKPLNEIIEVIFEKLSKRKNETAILLISLAILNLFTFAHIYTLESEKDLTKIYFLDVGQGDSQLITFPGGAKILIDGGPPKNILHNITKALTPFDRRIDIIANTHPQLDHFGGLIDILERYKVSIFASNGLNRDIPSYNTLTRDLIRTNTQQVVLLAGDKIHYGSSTLHIIHPTQNDIDQTKDINESSLVTLLESNNTKTLFTADIGKKTEKSLLPLSFPERSGAESKGYPIDILKISHHGSKNSSDKTFLQATNPKISVIQVGKNSYGHPSKETLSRLAQIGTKLYRNDQSGTIKITSDGKELKIYKIH